MNFKIALYIVGAFLIYACSGSNLDKEKELQKREQAVKNKEEEVLREKEEMLDKKEIDLERKDNVNAKKQGGEGEKHIAVIEDPDGYTNVREGMSTESKIIDRLFEGEHYVVYPTADNNWWMVYTQAKVRGYVHKSRVRIID